MRSWPGPPPTIPTRTTGSRPDPDLDDAPALLEDIRPVPGEADPVKRRELVGQLVERVWIGLSHEAVPGRLR
jgi:hypothetical protein